MFSIFLMPKVYYCISCIHFIVILWLFSYCDIFARHLNQHKNQNRPKCKINIVNTQSLSDWLRSHSYRISLSVLLQMFDTLLFTLASLINKRVTTSSKNQSGSLNPQRFTSHFTILVNPKVSVVTSKPPWVFISDPYPKLYMTGYTSSFCHFIIVPVACGFDSERMNGANKMHTLNAV